MKKSKEPLEKPSNVSGEVIEGPTERECSKGMV